ncbi:MAG: helix-turn-helix domain-containing protein [Candidatus Edwardsbacteria bacterium]
MKRKKIGETHYRASRLCRVLGNPTAYMILITLAERKMTPSQISKRLGVSLATISDTLRSLRQIDLVRYEAKRECKLYWIKDPIVLEIVRRLEAFVKRMRDKRW